MNSKNVDVKMNNNMNENESSSFNDSNRVDTDDSNQYSSVEKFQGFSMSDFNNDNDGEYVTGKNNTAFSPSSLSISSKKNNESENVSKFLNLTKEKLNILKGPTSIDSNHFSSKEDDELLQRVNNIFS